MISTYGILISTSILSCILVAEYFEKIHSRNPDLLWKVSLNIIVFGIIGARIYHVLSALPYYTKYPIQVLYFWNGGLAIWGAVAGGIAAIWLTFRKNREEFFHFLDLSAVVIPLGQAIGRWGNYFNQELYGKPSDLPWAIYIPYDKRPPEYSIKNYFHPLFLYESVLNFLLFIFLLKQYKSKYGKKYKGFFLFIYLVGYSIIRFALEPLRINAWQIFGLNVAQLISILVLVFALLNLIKRRNI